MKLSSGIKISIDNDFTIKDTVMINDGVEEAVGFDRYNEKRYADGAFKPKNNWRNLTDEEIIALTKLDESDDFSTIVGLKKLPGDIVKIVEEIGINAVKDGNELKKVVLESKEKAAVLNAQIEAFCNRFLMPGLNMVFHAFGVLNGNLETTAYNQKTGEYFGLHLDIGKGGGYKTAALSANRITFNFSKERRSLLFVNKSVKELGAMLTSIDSTIIRDDINVDKLVNLFFTHFPDYPVIRVIQNPYEVYIAPTDNIIHDGSTYVNAAADINLVMRGFFNPLLC